VKHIYNRMHGLHQTIGKIGRRHCLSQDSRPRNRVLVTKRQSFPQELGKFGNLQERTVTICGALSPGIKFRHAPVHFNHCR